MKDLLDIGFRRVGAWRLSQSGLELHHGDFLLCVARVESLLDATRPNYPTAIIVNMCIIYMGRLGLMTGP